MGFFFTEYRSGLHQGQRIDSSSVQGGNTWLINFLRRNKLTMKKAEMISSAQMSNTANPFIIYDFFDQFENVNCLLLIQNNFVTFSMYVQ